MHVLVASTDVICVGTHGSISVSRFEDERSRFILCDSFQLQLPDGQNGAPMEVVAAAMVVDAGSGLREPVLALRAAALPEGSGFEYNLAVIDLQARELDRLATCMLSPTFSHASHMLVDGPALCVQAEVSQEPTCLRVCAIASCVAQGDRGKPLLLDELVFTLGELKSILCTISWTGYAEDTVALCVSAASMHHPAALIDIPLHNVRSHGTALGGVPLSSRTPAAAALAPFVSCAVADLEVSGVDADGCLLFAHRLWLGTTSAMLHCCGCDGEVRWRYTWRNTIRMESLYPRLLYPCMYGHSCMLLGACPA